MGRTANTLVTDYLSGLLTAILRVRILQHGLRGRRLWRLQRLKRLHQLLYTSRPRPRLGNVFSVAEFTTLLSILKREYTYVHLKELIREVNFKVGAAEDRSPMPGFIQRLVSSARVTNGRALGGPYRRKKHLSRYRALVPQKRAYLLEELWATKQLDKDFGNTLSEGQKLALVGEYLRVSLKRAAVGRSVVETALQATAIPETV